MPGLLPDSWDQLLLLCGHHGEGRLGSPKEEETKSTQRQNARRREEFLKKKVNASTEKKLSYPGEPGHPLVACILCSVFTHYTVYSFKELCSEAQMAGSVDYSLHSVYYTVYSAECMVQTCAEPIGLAGREPLIVSPSQRKFQTNP